MREEKIEELEKIIDSLKTIKKKNLLKNLDSSKVKFTGAI